MQFVKNFFFTFLPVKRDNGIAYLLKSLVYVHTSGCMYNLRPKNESASRIKTLNLTVAAC